MVCQKRLVGRNHILASGNGRFGRIAGGATVERAVDTGFDQTPYLLFNLADADLTTALRVADAIYSLDDIGKHLVEACL